MRRYIPSILCLMFFVSSASCLADPPIETVIRTKQATALVSVELEDGTAEGSAFCIDSSGLFVTNAHVIEGFKPGGKLTLVLHSGESDQVKSSATIVKVDRNRDLAVLKIANAKNLTALSLGNISGLVETMSVVAFGYPFGTDLALKQGDYPSITVSTGHITSLRRINGELAAIQLDASLNEGNSGGPIVDSKGEVIAIVMEGIPGSGINLAIPVSYLRSFLSSLNISFSPPPVRAGHLHDRQDFRIDLLKPVSGTDAAVVEITLSAGEGDKRSVTAETADGRTYFAHIAFLRAQVTDIPESVAYSIRVTQSGKLVASEDGEISLVDATSQPIGNRGAPAPAVQSIPSFYYDGFDYPAGSRVANQNGGTRSWSNAWNEFGQGNTSSLISDGGLTFGNLKTSGNAVMTTSDNPVGHARAFQTSPGKTGGVLFISYLVKPLEGSSGRFLELVYGNLSIGGCLGYYDLDRSGGGDRVPTRVPIIKDQTVFLVARITFGGENENDVVDLFVNPTPGRPLPATPDATKTDHNTGRPKDFNLGTNMRCVFDEVRFGRTFAEVAPVK